jgi:predicted DNA-binding protein
VASVETTTIRVRRGTHERLQMQAELTGQSVTQVLEEAADMLEEAKLLESAERAWRRGAERPAEIVGTDAARDDEWVRELESRPPLADRD